LNCNRSSGLGSHQCCGQCRCCCCCCCCNADVVLAGESYAGIYVPMLARAVVEGNRHGQKPHINIKVGGGCWQAGVG
jgi:hypothetical protein